MNAWPVLCRLDGFLLDGGPDRAAARRESIVATVTAAARAALERVR